MSRHRLVPSHALAPGRKAGKVPREYRHSQHIHRAVRENPEAGLLAAGLTLSLATAVLWFLDHFGLAYPH